MKTATVVAWYVKAEIVCVAAVALIVGYLGWLMFSSPFSHAEFDQRAWALITPATDNSCARGAMVDSLLKEHVQIGMQKSQLVALLGKPDYDHGGEASYELGYCQTFVDPDTLDFYFDQQGALTKHVIKNH